MNYDLFEFDGDEESEAEFDTEVQKPPFACIFDCDGTLIDSMPAWREVEFKLARKIGSHLTREQTDYITTLTLPEVAQYFYADLGIGNSPQDILDMIDDLMMDFYTHEAKPKPGALEFVRLLHWRGIPLAIASSTPSELLRAGITHAGFAPYMEAIVSVNDVGRSKREPDVYDYARSFLGTERANTVGFEDATYAARTLAAAGYRTVGIYDCDLSGTYDDLAQTTDVVVRSFTELDGGSFVVPPVLTQRAE